MDGAAMPETAIDKNADVATGEDNVCGNAVVGQGSMAHAES